MTHSAVPPVLLFFGFLSHFVSIHGLLLNSFVPLKKLLVTGSDLERCSGNRASFLEETRILGTR